MSIVWSESIDTILGSGRFLSDDNNWVLKRAEALDAIDALEAMRTAILGGDVYVVAGTNVEMNHDSWYCDRDTGESHDAYVLRCGRSAREYITTYRPSRDDVLFAIVPGVP